MLDVAAEGIAQAEVFAQMLAALVQAGADGLYIAWAPGQWGEHRHRYVTTPPGVLSRGTYVTVELMRDIRGYQGQVCQPFVIGEPTSEAAEIFVSTALRSIGLWNCYESATRSGRSRMASARSPTARNTRST